ncbi:hypothetical protein JWG45_20175 [Leptospira sp. 201903070]|jgi:hypothetical protein|uniref:Uncharacterized protein n=1 Tax=Leptospira ainlahdjerensis TaxID=2810033 RepID=A0ABS2UGG4_9LEPT|nr:hypothetical protein [Leptospira ainlahdjerensis]MBM9579465.1 hypothetical protein [Leptospira ainlahdjerensis]
MEEFRISTAIADIPVGLSAAYGFWNLIGSVKWRLVQLGFFTISLTAFLYGMIPFFPSFTEGIHSVLKHVAQEIAFPLLCLPFFSISTGIQIDNKRSTILLFALASFSILSHIFGFSGIYKLIVGIAASLLWIVSSMSILKRKHLEKNLKKSALLILTGALLFILNGIWVGKTGSIFGIPRFDLFLYVSAIGIFFIALGVKFVSKEQQS